MKLASLEGIRPFKESTTLKSDYRCREAILMFLPGNREIVYLLKIMMDLM